MKRVTIFALLLITALLLCGCMERGNVNQVRKTVGESTVYTKAEIEDAMDVVIGHFRREFEGCTLIHLYFDEDTPAQYSERWAQQYDADEAIILVSSFEVGPNGSDGSLSPNNRYDGWQWILVRNTGGPWTLRTSGFG